MDRFTLRTGETYPTHRAWTGPLIATVYGRPYLLYDLLFPVTPGSPNHYIPKTRQYDVVSLTQADYDFLSPFQIEEELKKTRGRPLRFKIDEAREIFKVYWSTGRKTQGELARKHGVTRLAIHHL